MGHAVPIHPSRFVMAYPLSATIGSSFLLLGLLGATWGLAHGPEGAMAPRPVLVLVSCAFAAAGLALLTAALFARATGGRARGPILAGFAFAASLLLVVAADALDRAPGARPLFGFPSGTVLLVLVFWPASLVFTIASWRRFTRSCESTSVSRWP